VNGIARGTAQALMMSLVVMPFHYTRQSAAMGFFQAIYSVGIVAGPTIAGIVTAFAGLNTAFYILGALGLIAPILGLIMLPDERKALPADPLGVL
jgi:MFS family permease